MSFSIKWGSPNSSAGKESACNAGDPSSIPGLGRFPGEAKGYPLQYSWASLVAQIVKNPPTIWKTWVQSLGWEDPLEKGKATHSRILAQRIPRGDCKEQDATEQLSLSFHKRHQIPLVKSDSQLRYLITQVFFYHHFFLLCEGHSIDRLVS